MFKKLHQTFFQRKKPLINFLLTVPRDLKALPFKTKLAIIVLGCFMLWNTFFDFNHFINPHDYPSLWTINNSKKFQLWQQVLLTLNGIATFTNIIAVLLIALSKISNYFWGFIAVSIYGSLALAWGYVGDMQLNLLFFLPFQIIGYHLWKVNLNNDNNIIAQRLTFKTTIFTIYFAMILMVVFYFEIPEFSRVILGEYTFDGTDFKKVLPHMLDAGTIALSIVAQILMVLRFREQWIIWIIVNIFHIIMFSGIAHNRLDINLLLMSTIALGNAGFGFYQWFFVHKQKIAPPTTNAMPNFEQLQLQLE